MQKKFVDSKVSLKNFLQGGCINKNVMSDEQHHLLICPIRGMICSSNWEKTFLETLFTFLINIELMGSSFRVPQQKLIFTSF